MSCRASIQDIQQIKFVMTGEFAWAGWAAEQRIGPLGPCAAQTASSLHSHFRIHGLTPQTVKGCRSKVVHSMTGKDSVVHDRII